MCRMSTGWRMSTSSPAARSRSMNSRKVSVKGWAFRLFASSAFIAVLVEFGADLAHDLRPTLALAPDERRELLRRHRQRLAAFVLQARLEVWGGNQRADLRVEPFQNVGRGTRRRDHAEPGHQLVAPQGLPRDGRPLRQPPPA